MGGTARLYRVSNDRRIGFPANRNFGLLFTTQALFQLDKC
jgi:hypothetical protein